MVYIIREPLTVAHSWERRAKNPKDTWPEANGAERGIEEWVRSLDIISAAAPAWGDALVVVDYDRFFDCSTVEEFRLNIARLYRTLDLPVSRTITERAAQRNFREKSAEHRDPTNLPYYAQAIAAQANPKLAPLLARAI
jgi:hypothetical protein